MTISRIIGSVALALSITHVGRTADLAVPSQYPTLQAAINAASSGDRILLAGGVYSGPFSISGKSVTIQGPAWRNATPSAHLVGGGTTVTISGNGTQAVTLENLFIRDSSIGVVSENVDLVMNDCFLMNFSNTSGNGGCCRQVYRSVTANRCFFRQGRAAWGGGVYLGFGSGTLADCVFEGNTAINSGGAGFVQSGSSLRLIRCWLANQNVDIATNSTGYLRDSRLCQSGMFPVAFGASVVDEGGNISTPTCADCDARGGPDLVSLGLGLGDCNGDLVPDHCDVPCPPIQWPAATGGNGHWYQRIPRQERTWQQCLQAARSLGGDLASLGSAGEQSAVEPLVPRSMWGFTNVVFFGGSQPPSSPANAGWTWSDSSAWGFTAWEPGQPNGSEGCLALYRYANAAGAIEWGDWPPSDPQIMYFAVEWSADCNADGIVDYGQILDGTFPDGNGNGVPDCCEGGGSCCVGDILADRVINGADLGALLFYWGVVTSAPLSQACDLDRSGTVDGADLGALLASWGACP